MIVSLLFHSCFEEKKGEFKRIAFPIERMKWVKWGKWEKIFCLNFLFSIFHLFNYIISKKDLRHIPTFDRFLAGYNQLRQIIISVLTSQFIPCRHIAYDDFQKFNFIKVILDADDWHVHVIYKTHKMHFSWFYLKKKNKKHKIGGLPIWHCKIYFH